ncbi:MAG: cofactor-independent phosphoglycerate mutase [Ruminococcaceae bacterium]|nr:cofactor-independent phosphoglycerate mutase [Oscillospiraceae bacterium]
MKYLVLIPDGAADYPIPELGGMTPFEAAEKPTLDALAREAEVGTVSNVPAHMVPESDTANLAILSYDPTVYSKGRSPLEAMSMGLTMKEGDIAFRCNVVTVSEDGDCYEDKIMLDHSADEITTAEAAELVKALEEAFGTDSRTFYPGVSYRHCMIWNDPPAYTDFERPHDHLGHGVRDIMPPEPYATLVRKSYEVLNHHPINEARRARGLRPANSIWLWSPGAKPALSSFKEKWGLDATVISAVDLIKGIGICAEMESVDVEGATGNYKTNYKGKADAAIDAFRRGKDLVYVHVEAPDECGHRAELENKVLSIGLISEKILKPVTEYLAASGEPYAVMLLPDHPTPICRRTHTLDAVPYLIWRSDRKADGVECFCEKTAAAKEQYLPSGYRLMDKLIRG